MSESQTIAIMAALILTRPSTEDEEPPTLAQAAKEAEELYRLVDRKKKPAAE